MGKLKEAVESGDKREILLALRDVTASTIEETKSGRDVAALTDAHIEMRLQKSYPGIVNHDAETALAQGAAERLLGKDHVQVLDYPTMKTEDFGYFLLHCPGVYYHFGAGCELPLHNPGFLPGDSIASTAAAVNAAVVHTFLNGNQTER